MATRLPPTNKPRVSWRTRAATLLLGPNEVLEAARHLRRLNHVAHLNILEEIITPNDIAKRRETSVHKIPSGGGKLGIKQEEEEL
jgi:hypothetical protein